MTTPNTAALEPQCWMRPADIEGCYPVVTFDPDEAREWKLSGRRVTALAAAPVQAAPGRDHWQRYCTERGYYWREPDAHGCDFSAAQAADMLADLLGVEVNVAGVANGDPGRSAPLPHQPAQPEGAQEPAEPAPLIVGPGDWHPAKPAAPEGLPPLPWARAVDLHEGTERPSNWKLLFGDECYGSGFTHTALYTGEQVAALAAASREDAAPHHPSRQGGRLCRQRST